MGLDTVELVIRIENHFAIRITHPEAEQIYRVQDFYDVVARHLSASGRTAANFELEINEIIAYQSGTPLDEILPHKSLTNDLGMD